MQRCLVVLLLMGCDGGSAEALDTGSGGQDGESGDPSDAGTSNACTGAEGFPDLIGSPAIEGASTACVALQGETFYIYASLQGLAQEDFAPRLARVLGIIVGAEVPATDVSGNTTVFTFDGSGMTNGVRARAAWSEGITRLHLALSAAPVDAVGSPLIVQKDGPRPCRLTPAEVDLCRRQNFLRAACDALPAADACRDLLELLVQTSCERGPDCSALETCQSGVCCPLGSLACGMECYIPAQCKTCVGGVLDDYGRLGEEGLGKECKFCFTDYAPFSAPACSCTPACEANACCSEAGTDKCVDKTSDPQHCGQCGNACEQGEACTAGRCEDDDRYHVVGEYSGLQVGACANVAYGDFSDGVTFDLVPDPSAPNRYTVTAIMNEGTIGPINVRPVPGMTGPDVSISIDSPSEILLALGGYAEHDLSNDFVTVFLDYSTAFGACSISYPEPNPQFPPQSWPGSEDQSTLIFGFNANAFVDHQQGAGVSHRTGGGFWRFTITR